MSLPTTFSNVLIEGNTIDAGASTDGVTTTQFTYANLLTTIADCRIFNNYWSGITNNTVNTYMIIALVDACNIQGNTFVRGSSNITAYIRSGTTFDQIITGNMFDGYTSDGSSNTLVANLSSNSLYTNNKNQVGYAVIPLGTDKPAIFGIDKSITKAYGIFNSSAYPPSATTQYGVTSGYLYDPYVLTIYDDTVSPGSNTFLLNVDITRSVPVGAKIIDVKYSVYSPSGVGLSGTNTFTMTLIAGLNHTQSIDTKTYDNSGTLLTMVGYTSRASLTVASNTPDLHAAYQAIEIPTLNFSGFAGPPSSITTVSNTDISSHYITGNDYGITAFLRFDYQAAVQGSASPYIPLLLVSPLIVTYVF